MLSGYVIMVLGALSALMDIDASVIEKLFSEQYRGKEKLLESDDTSYSYEIVESPLPVKNYSAKLWVEPDDRDPAR